MRTILYLVSLIIERVDHWPNKESRFYGLREMESPETDKDCILAGSRYDEARLAFKADNQQLFRYEVNRANSYAMPERVGDELSELGVERSGYSIKIEELAPFSRDEYAAIMEENARTRKALIAQRAASYRRLITEAREPEKLAEKLHALQAELYIGKRVEAYYAHGSYQPRDVKHLRVSGKLLKVTPHKATGYGQGRVIDGIYNSQGIDYLHIIPDGEKLGGKRIPVKVFAFRLDQYRPTLKALEPLTDEDLEKAYERI